MPDLTALLVTLKNHPVCTGVLRVPTSDLTLYYGTTSVARRINFSSASAEELSHLSNSCSAATFGLNKEDVLDESYRKAGKMDAEDFALKFDIANSGLLELVATDLLEGNDAVVGIDYELYNLNVYSEGSFFKVHRDTPRSDRMLGSLVIVFPSAHTGGTLIMRHGGQEWEFDSGTLLQDASSPSIAYAAFYSDVEHEVLPVTSGHRVTVTYNLYYPQPSEKPTPVIAPSDAISRSPFYTALSGLLAETSFIPEGCTIGFGLSHKYPVSEDTALSSIAQRLKGPDAIVYGVCQALNLDPQLRVLYNCEYDATQVLCDCFADLSYIEMEANLSDFLEQEYDGEVYHTRDREGEDRIIWATPATDYARVAQNYMVYGNVAEVATQYADVCLVIKLPVIDRRLEILRSIRTADAQLELEKV